MLTASYRHVKYLPGGWYLGSQMGNWRRRAKRGGWGVELISIHESGALPEFILADWHRVHHFSHPF
ncbi:hypothetical protein OG21DRAFT_765941 [Imleria badia]|nr:hypothetical protein OG21DRAFT_765941 [Imleria badia]